MPIPNDLRTLFIENRNLHCLPQSCRGVLVSIEIDKAVFIGCLSYMDKKTISLYLWKQQMRYCDRLNYYFPDFSMVTHNQRRCFNVNETIFEQDEIKMVYLNQINGLLNNRSINHEDKIDKFDRCYESSIDGPDILSGFGNDVSKYVVTKKQQHTSVVSFSSLCYNIASHNKKHYYRPKSIFNRSPPTYIVNDKRKVYAAFVVTSTLK